MLGWEKLDPKRELFLRTLWAYLGTPYIWGGDDPSGFDCSGLVIEGLKTIGVVPRVYDNTADGLYRTFLPGAGGHPKPGDLAFRVSGGRAVHVETVIMVEEKTAYLLGASGGGSRTNSPADAWKQNAYVRVRPLEWEAHHDWVICSLI